MLVAQGSISMHTRGNSHDKLIFQTYFPLSLPFSFSVKVKNLPIIVDRVNHVLEGTVYDDKSTTIPMRVQVSQ